MGGASTSHSSDYDFSQDRNVTGRSAQDYAKADDRVYTGSSSAGIKPPVGKDISTDSPLAALLLLDQTGSMKFVPKLMIDKMGPLYHEANAVLQGIDLDELKKGKKPNELLELSVIAIGDARGDRFPIQAVDFGKAADLVKGVNRIYPEGNGGGNEMESYDLSIYYAVNHCKMPNVPKGTKPLAVIVGDEGFYDTVEPDYVEHLIGDHLTKPLQTKNLIKAMMNKFDTYLLRPELCNYPASTYARIHEQWSEALGTQRVLRVKDPHRIVDDFIMLCGIAADNYANAIGLLERRQIDEDRPREGIEKLSQVLETMHPIIGNDRVKAEVARLRKKWEKK